MINMGDGKSNFSVSQRYFGDVMKNKDNNSVNKKIAEPKKNLSTTRQILLGFMATIVVGTVLLSLPIAVVSGEPDVLTALFTATTSVCVTGLVVVNTFSHWTIFGKIVILLLIQLGGLGIVAFTSAVMLMLNRKVTLSNRMVIQDAFSLNNLQGMVRFVKKVILGTIVVELAGALCYLIAFLPKYGAAKGIWFAVFNSISAFCNAGIDILGPDSLMSFSSSPIVLITTMFLICFGGLGFVVWWDVIDVLHKVFSKEISPSDFFRNLKTHSKIVIITTISLILSGMLLILMFEYNNPATLGNMGFGDKLLNSFFQSVSLRTAGFATIDQAGLSDPSVLVCIIFMIIGGSPVGTAGGIKTVSFAVLLLAVISVIKGRKETVVFNKSIKEELIRRSLAVTFISITVFFVFSITLILSNGLSLTDASFEVASAIGTVGLSRNITPDLNSFGRILIVIAMYLGRIGPISMFVAFSNKYSIKNSIHYAEADIIVG